MPADGTSVLSNEWASWVRLARPPEFAKKPIRTISVVDLFSGCGGMTLGLVEAARQVNASCNVKLAIDFNESAVRVYRDNFGVGENIAYHADVRKMITGGIGSRFDASIKKLIAKVGELDVLVAGPPCQGHSDLNNHSRRDDPRNDLYLTAIRAVEAFSPKCVIIENVAPIVHDKTGITSLAKAHLQRLGYSTIQAIVEMTHFGVPQRRRRHVTIASRFMSEELLGKTLQCDPSDAATVRHFIDDLEDEGLTRVEPFCASTKVSLTNAERINWLFRNRAYDLPDALRPACHRDKPHSYRSMYGRIHWDLPAQTITTGFGSMGQGRYVHPSRPRMITCHEAARLQGFPDFFSFSSCGSLTALREMIGNAVPPPFMASLAQRLLQNR